MNEATLDGSSAMDDANESVENSGNVDEERQETTFEHGPAESYNPTLPEDMEGDAVKMKGDAIGSTLYSERWVLKLLISISKFDQDSWSEELEGELCSLWDMTFEADVVTFLLKHDFINLAKQAIQTCSVPRLSEIMVGILGNMASQKEARVSLTQTGFADFLLKELMSSSDTLTLIQVVRLMNTCAWYVTKGTQASMDDEDEDAVQYSEAESWINLFQDNSSELSRSLAFILTSSTNDELLKSTLELINNLFCITMKNSYFSEFLTSSEVITGLTEALHQLLLGDEDDDAMNCVWGSDSEKVALHWTAVLNSFTLYDSGLKLLYEYRQDIMRSICTILDPLNLAENLLPLSSQKIDILESIIGVLESMGSKSDYMPPAILPRVLTLLSHLSPVSNRDDFETEEQQMVGEDEMEELLEIRRKIIGYCVISLNTADSADFLQAFGTDPQPKVENLLDALLKCKDDEVKKLIVTMKNHLVKLKNV